MKKIVLKFKDKNLVLNLRDTPTADMIYKELPFTSTVKKWGQEIYFETHINVELEDNAKAVVEFGEIAFWNGGSAIAIGYGKTPVSVDQEIRLIGPCNVWADGSFKKSDFDNIKSGDEISLDWR